MQHTQTKRIAASAVATLALAAALFSGITANAKTTTSAGYGYTEIGCSANAPKGLRATKTPSLKTIVRLSWKKVVFDCETPKPKLYRVRVYKGDTLVKSYNSKVNHRVVPQKALSAGSYTFMVRAVAKDDLTTNWSAARSFTIVKQRTTRR